MKKIFLLSIVILCSFIAQSQESMLGHDSRKWKQIVDLRGKWKIELGNNQKWADPKFNDTSWEEIFVPADWENEGFPNYDGYAWYRKTFTVPQNAKGKTLFLQLGYVDDVSEVYVNGNLIGGFGSFPPNYETAYNQFEILPLLKKYLNESGENTIAVKVYDDQLNGGIVGGKIGIYERIDETDVDIRFSDLWKFKTGDDLTWKEMNYDDSKWSDLIVPMKWDAQGYQKYDGFAWYRIKFNIADKFKNENLVLLLGKIDDFDETYVNGELVGKTGKIRSDGNAGKERNEYQLYRAYSISSSLLKYGEENVLAVRVYDGKQIGGIYEGPIGMVSRSKFRQWQKNIQDNNRNEQNSFERLMDAIFNNK